LTKREGSYLSLNKGSYLTGFSNKNNLLTGVYRDRMNYIGYGKGLMAGKQITGIERHLERESHYQIKEKNILLLLRKVKVKMLHYPSLITRQISGKEYAGI